MTAAAAVSAHDCCLPTVVPRSLMLNGEPSWTPCESKRHKSTPCPGVASDPLDSAFCGQPEQSRVLRIDDIHCEYDLEAGKLTTLFSCRKHSPFAVSYTLHTPSNSDTGYVDESAIGEENDSSDWEDSIEDGTESSIDGNTFFQRVNSTSNLTSHRSLITIMIDQQTRTRHPVPPTLAVSANDSDDTSLMMRRGNRRPPLKPVTGVPRSAAQPILTTASHSHLQAALSPRTNRRNMLAVELPEDLRRDMLWERQQTFSTANAVHKRRDTSHNSANLEQHPNYDSGNYHSKGW
ncbi:DUF1752 domain-containing protein [Colletotrichum chrysophilum]|uniref:DUF1752 domain-containing protein n=1 Tax=Colletotrichum chrysophilum TaxID=1836956 RepID=A0AAD9E9W0_9PEZI|nr:DUF1752 domain-containing protein [Colletotrichum chrysophilum]